MLRWSTSKGQWCQSWPCASVGVHAGKQTPLQSSQRREFKAGDWLYAREVKLNMVKQCRNWDQAESHSHVCYRGKQDHTLKPQWACLACVRLQETRSEQGEKCPVSSHLPILHCLTRASHWPNLTSWTSETAPPARVSMVDKTHRERGRLDSRQTGSGPVMCLWETVSMTNMQ